MIQPLKGAVKLFQIGDKVAHPGHGGCLVQDICTRKIGPEPTEYLVLIPYNESNTQILVPVASADKVGLRGIISEEVADSLLESFSMGDADLEWESNHTKRRQAYVDILKTGTLPALATMIRELTFQSKLSNGDKELLPRAQRKLFSEIALAKDIEFQRVLNMAEFQMQPSVAAM